MPEKCFLCGKEAIVAYADKPICHECSGLYSNYEPQDMVAIKDYTETNVVHVEPVVEYYSVFLNEDSDIEFDDCLKSTTDGDANFHDDKSNNDLSNELSDVIRHVATQLNLLKPIL